MYVRYVHMSGLSPGMCHDIGVRVVDVVMAHVRISRERLCVNLHACTYVRCVHMSGQVSGMCRAIGVSAMRPEERGSLGSTYSAHPSSLARGRLRHIDARKFPCVASSFASATSLQVFF